MSASTPDFEKYFQYGIDAYMVGHPNMASTSLSKENADAWKEGWKHADSDPKNRAIHHEYKSKRSLNDNVQKWRNRNFY